MIEEFDLEKIIKINRDWAKRNMEKVKGYHKKYIKNKKEFNIIKSFENI